MTAPAAYSRVKEALVLQWGLALYGNLASGLEYEYRQLGLGSVARN